MRCPNWPYLTYTSHIFSSGSILGFHPKSCKNADRKVQGDVSKARIESKANPILGDLWKFRNQIVHSAWCDVECEMLNAKRHMCECQSVASPLCISFQTKLFQWEPTQIICQNGKAHWSKRKHDYSSQWELSKDRRFGSSCNLHSWRSKWTKWSLDFF